VAMNIQTDVKHSYAINAMICFGGATMSSDSSHMKNITRVLVDKLFRVFD